MICFCSARLYFSLEKQHYYNIYVSCTLAFKSKTEPLNALSQPFIVQSSRVAKLLTVPYSIPLLASGRRVLYVFLFCFSCWLHGMPMGCGSIGVALAYDREHHRSLVLKAFVVESI